MDTSPHSKTQFSLKHSSSICMSQNTVRNLYNNHLSCLFYDAFITHKIHTVINRMQENNKFLIELF